jgi:hypothetical protein
MLRKDVHPEGSDIAHARSSDEDGWWREAIWGQLIAYGGESVLVYPRFL